MKNLAALLFFILLSTAALAQEETLDDSQDSFPAAQSHVVTSVKTCYDQLEPAEALEIQKNSLKPYQECINRLSEKMQKKKTLKATQEAQETAEAEEEAEAETPRNYVRVTKTPKADKKKAKTAEDEDGDTAEPSKKDTENK